METIIPADPVKLTRSWLLEPDQYPWPVSVLNRRPNPMSGRVVTVRRSGGLRGAVFVTDQAWLSVECFAPTAEATADLAHHTWGLLFAMQGKVIDGIQCYRVQDLAAPADMYDPEAQRDRYVMSVQASFRAGQSAFVPPITSD